MNDKLNEYLHDIDIALVEKEQSLIKELAERENITEKLKSNNLELILKKETIPINIMVDGRYLWRIFDNLLSNICKYALCGSRVYLSLSKKDNTAEFCFKNISKYELDVSPDELTGRFVRADKSRSTEGSGLGLSIAKSLTELQNGSFEILTDGDLFKVNIKFNIIQKINR